MWNQLICEILVHGAFDNAMQMHNNSVLSCYTAWITQTIHPKNLLLCFACCCGKVTIPFISFRLFSATWVTWNPFQYKGHLSMYRYFIMKIRRARIRVIFITGIPVSPGGLKPLPGGCPGISPHYNDVIMGATTSQITSLTIVPSTAYSGEDQRKHQSFASLAFVRTIHRWPVNSPHRWPVRRKCFHLMTSSCWRIH